MQPEIPYLRCEYKKGINRGIYSKKKFKKGQSCGATMSSVRTIMRKFPELFENVIVMQQPAAYRDAIIVGWCMEDLHERYDCVLQQHDLVGIQSTSEIKKKRFAC